MIGVQAREGSIFISPSGNDQSGDGSMGAPWYTLSKAVSFAGPGGNPLSTTTALTGVECLQAAFTGNTLELRFSGFRGEPRQATLRIINLAGQMVFQAEPGIGEFKSSRLQMVIPALEKGIYLILLETGSERLTVKTAHP
ncbi:MAG: T9SS type A sorting domain-containing protein [Bacteroidales bacterium]|nr:T9SS type A sorting domain-containing protein [Bacteroidales bacterium]